MFLIEKTFLFHVLVTLFYKNPINHNKLKKLPKNNSFNILAHLLSIDKYELILSKDEYDWLNNYVSRLQIGLTSSADQARAEVLLYKIVISKNTSIDDYLVNAWYYPLPSIIWSIEYVLKNVADISLKIFVALLILFLLSFLVNIKTATILLSLRFFIKISVKIFQVLQRCADYPGHLSDWRNTLKFYCSSWKKNSLIEILIWHLAYVFLPLLVILSIFALFNEDFAEILVEFLNNISKVLWTIYKYTHYLWRPFVLFFLYLRKIINEDKKKKK
uniref:Uncharacterized protein n=1 Tax=Ishige okamurae TaxID=233772 RepID=A0A4Y5T8X0_9PHAE|nr:hypothetical protein [Ishige okamurae]